MNNMFICGTCAHMGDLESIVSKAIKEEMLQFFDDSVVPFVKANKDKFAVRCCPKCFSPILLYPADAPIKDIKPVEIRPNWPDRKPVKKSSSIVTEDGEEVDVVDKESFIDDLPDNLKAKARQAIENTKPNRMPPPPQTKCESCGKMFRNKVRRSKDQGGPVCNPCLNTRITGRK